MQMKRDDQNVHIHFRQQVLDYMKLFSFNIVNSEAKGTFYIALPEMIDD